MMAPGYEVQGYTKLVTKRDIGGRGYLQIVTSLPEKNFLFRLFLVMAWREGEREYNEKSY